MISQCTEGDVWEARFDKFWNILVSFRAHARRAWPRPFQPRSSLVPLGQRWSSPVLVSSGVSTIHLIKPQWKGRVGGDEEITLPAKVNWHIFRVQKQTDSRAAKGAPLSRKRYGRPGNGVKSALKPNWIRDRLSIKFSAGYQGRSFCCDFPPTEASDRRDLE